MPNTLSLGARVVKNDSRLSEPDLVIVGGGIAGGALATAIARESDLMFFSFPEESGERDTSWVRFLSL